MDKIERITNFPNIEGFETHYNKYPSKLIEKIDEDTFVEMLLHYSWDYEDSRQIMGKGDQKLFILVWNQHTVGIMISKKSGESSKYFKFGDWSSFNIDFANQFVGDNS